MEVPVRVAYYRDDMDSFLVNSKEMTTRMWVIDALIAVAAFAFGCLQLLISTSPVIVTDETFRQMIGVINTTPSLSAYIAMAITTFPLVLRRQFSWPVFIFVMITFLGMQNLLSGYSFTIIGPAIALFTIAYERNRNELIVATTLAIIALIFVPLPAQNANMASFIRIQYSSYLIVAALAGFGVRTHQEYLFEVEQKALAAEKSREEEAARRVEEERVRIAREIHDITAHSLSAVSIQAAAAERLVDKNSDAAKQAIQTVRATSKDALEEIRSMIGVLRSGDAVADTAPTSGTDRLIDLVSYLGNAGIKVDLFDAMYERSRVPSYIDIALYGIAREAVTNIVRHADASEVRIVLSTSLDKADLRVEDNGIGIIDDAAYEGHGIQGMRERVSLLKGSFEVGNRPEGGYYVQARIPLLELGQDYG